MGKHFLIGTVIVIMAGAIVFTELQIARSNRTLADVAGPLTEKQYAEAARKRLGLDSTPPAPLVPLELKRPVRLALGSLGLADDEQNGRLSDLVLTKLNGAQGLELVERKALEQVLRELNLNLSGFARAKDAVRAGKLLKADWFLLGTGAKINGTNSIVIRVVDARTGILREAGVFSSEKPQAQLAGDIADFVRQSRREAASASTPVFLAIGTFQDLGLNNRAAGFPNELRAYLTAAYRGGKVTLLEREYVEMLLQEVRLDLAGLSEDSAIAPKPMQASYWLVSGSYQSYETTNVEVELTLNVEHMFGRAKYLTLRGPPGEPVSRRVKQEIDRIMALNHETVAPTRKSEILSQMSMGKDLLGMNGFGNQLGFWYSLGDWKYFDNFGKLDAQGVLRKRNIEEATRAFETVLLLDPGNREASLYLGRSLTDPLLGRVAEGRDYYRQVIEGGQPDQWTELAKKDLLNSFLNMMGAVANMSDKARWFQSTVQHSTNPSAAEFYTTQAQESEKAEKEAAILNGGGPEAGALAEQRLFSNLRSFDDLLHGKPGGCAEELGMYDFMQTFSRDEAAGARRLEELLPKMKIQFPELEPYYMAMVVRFQKDTNAPVIAKFRQKLKWISEHPTEVLKPKNFWSGLLPLCYACFDQKLYEIVAFVLEGRQRAASKDKTFPTIFQSEEADKIALGYAYEGMDHWQQAREIFETFSNHSVFMFQHGPWGGGLNTVLPGKEAAFCAVKLGQTPLGSVREFDLGQSCFCLCTPSAWEVNEDGPWIGINNQLLHLDFDLKTNLLVNLPKDSGSAITCLCLTDSAVWIGTDGEGLIEYNKTTRECRHLTEQDGLLMNNIACLNLAGPALWIGYGHRSYVYWAIGESHTEGGLGRLDLSTQKLTSFTPSIENRSSEGQEDARIPTRRPVIALTHGPENDIWLITEERGTRLRRYGTADNAWEAGPQTASSVAVDSKQLFLGQYWNFIGEDKGDQLGVRILDFKEAKWRSLKASDALPPGAVSALAPDGHDLWVGGRSYVALVDLEHDKIRKFARVKADAVDQIQIGGGYLWVSYDGHLHRALLHDVR